jgi:hypothetical protein
VLELSDLAVLFLNGFNPTTQALPHCAAAAGGLVELCSEQAMLGCAHVKICCTVHSHAFAQNPSLIAARCFALL